MRCNNCGWNNPADVHFCQKCNQPLVAAVVEENLHDEVPSIDPRATMVVQFDDNEEVVEEVRSAESTKGKNVSAEIAGTMMMFPSDTASKGDVSPTSDKTESKKQEKNIPNKTVVLNLEPAHRENSLKGTVIAEEPAGAVKGSAVPNLKQTVVAESAKHRDFKKTMPDDSLIKSMIEETEAKESEASVKKEDENAPEPVEKERFSIDLHAMDKEEGETELPVITLSSRITLAMKKGDIVLIANRRWQVK